MERAACASPDLEPLDVPIVEDERDELEDPEFEVESPPQGAEGGACLASCPRREPKAEAGKRRSILDQVQALNLNRDLNHLDQLHKEKELPLQRTRGELRASLQRVDLITRQQQKMKAKPALSKREADHHHVNTMWHSSFLEGHLEGLQPVARVEQVQTAQQLCKEQEVWGKIERNRLLRVRRSTHLQKEHGLRHQKLVEDARRNHRVAVKFLKASLGRVQEQEQQQEREAREHVQRRMDAVLALKSSITANRETLRKFQAWGQARAELAAQKAQAEKQAILAEGGDAFKLIFHQRRRQELEAQKRAFEEEQTLRKHEIVSRLLKEEAEESRKRRPPSPPATATATASATAQPSLRSKTWDYLADLSEGRTPRAPCPVECDSLPLPQRSGLMTTTSTTSSESIQGGSGSLNWEDETLAEPEISGLWNQGRKANKAPKEEVDRKPVRGTKMEKDILSYTMEQLRSGVVHKQVASGREFKGCPFNSKPKLIHFKDFDIGKVYKKRMTLINATYTINYCKLEGVDEHLRDFIHIDFDPPGPMSAGMSCEVLVTFKPMVEKDLEGRIWFLAQTGGFSVPLKCSIKQCSLALDKELINFGSYVVGETASRVITLSNVGALGTEFRIQLESEPCDSDMYQSAMRLSSVFTYDDRSMYEKGPIISQQRSEGIEPSLMEHDTMRSPESEDVTTILPVFSYEEQMEITLGEVTEGYIGPFSSIKVPIIFSPVTPGTVQSGFRVTFKNQQCPTLHFQVIGVAVDVPVWVPKSVVDLKICMFDRLYQDTIQVHTRSKAALRLKFEVCKELRGHMELLPETGYIQALSSYSVQLKFLPRLTLPEDAGKYFDRESRILEAPMTIRVADQVKPVEFTVHATITTSDLELSPLEVDFGYCTIYEAVRTSINVCNLSLLPQEFGFVGVPKFVDIQPNDGFGTILPLETMELDLIFQPTKAKEYSFELVCKSEINRCFKMTCQAVGVHPPLQLSHYQVRFSATALYDMSVASLYVINSHLSMNSLTHSVPRIGSQDTCPVGPTSFQFLLPPNSPITISPSVGTVLPGKVGVGPRGWPGTTACLCPPWHSRYGVSSPSPSTQAGQGPLWPASSARKRPALPGQGHHAVPQALGWARAMRPGGHRGLVTRSTGVCLSTGLVQGSPVSAFPSKAERTRTPKSSQPH